MFYSYKEYGESMTWTPRNPINITLVRGPIIKQSADRIQNTPWLFAQKLRFLCSRGRPPICLLLSLYLFNFVYLFLQNIKNLLHRQVFCILSFPNMYVALNSIGLWHILGIPFLYHHYDQFLLKTILQFNWFFGSAEF